MRPVIWLGVVVAAGLVAGFAWRPAPGWRPIAWPFPRDAFPAGLAFACSDASCGGALRVYVRTKRGFCANCATGVTTDAEVDGVADLDMLTADFVPLAPGAPVQVGGLAGRQRAYTLALPGGGHSPAVGMAMTRSRQCDLVVAVAEGKTAPAARSAIAALLASRPVATWIDRQLDGR